MCIGVCIISMQYISKVGDCSQERPEGSLFNSCYNEVSGRVLFIPWIAPLYS